MSDTLETDACVKENKHIKFLEEDHWVIDRIVTYTNPIVALCRKLERERDEALELLASEKSTRNNIVQRAAETERERDMYQRQADYMVERLGETQVRMINAERICNKIYMARNITLSEESILSAFAEIDKRYRTKNDGN